MAREIARALAPLFDLEDGPELTAQLARRPVFPPDADGAEIRTELERRDTVYLQITLSRA